jgi:hydrogenase 3 maturation protease
MGSPGAIEGRLRRWLKGCKRVVVVGIGNELRRDDFVGVKIVRGLKGRVPKHVMLVESETVPESFIEPIVSFSPTHILMIDAGLLGLEPGEARFVESFKVWQESTVPISTHALPLRIFCEYVAKETGAEVALLIIQPGRTDFGEGLTVKAKRAAHELICILPKILQETSPR